MIFKPQFHLDAVFPATKEVRPIVPLSLAISTCNISPSPLSSLRTSYFPNLEFLFCVYIDDARQPGTEKLFYVDMKLSSLSEYRYVMKTYYRDNTRCINPASLLDRIIYYSFCFIWEDFGIFDYLMYVQYIM